MYASCMEKNTYVYLFGVGETLTAGAELLGGKGAGLAQMASMGMPVPPGFTLSTEVCGHYYANDHAYPPELVDEVARALGLLEQGVNRRFGDAHDPLLLSVRSGSRVSMPGMMDTVLNVGLNDKTVEGLAQKSGDRRFAFDAYRRLLTMYGDVVMGVERRKFDEALRRAKIRLGDARMADPDIPESTLAALVDEYKAIIRSSTGQAFPDDVHAQLWGAIGAVFRSWKNPRAISYRRMNGYSDSWGTAVNVQSMVFGNLGDDSGSGVAFSRNPSTGENALYGEYLPNAQGEDVVAGVRTPYAISRSAAPKELEHQTLETISPKMYEALCKRVGELERHRRDMQDVEFTVERGKLWILQTRAGKRTGRAAVRIACELINEGLINQTEAISRIDAASLGQLMHPVLDTPEQLAKTGIYPLGRGLPASPGAASGQIVLQPASAEVKAAKGLDVVLVRNETSPDDIRGMKAARGILTATGGMTSHAAVVARGMGRPCIVGAGAISIDEPAGIVRIRREDGQHLELKEGAPISLDGTRGFFYGQHIEVKPVSGGNAELETLLNYADQRRRMSVRANADRPGDARIARGFGAQGIGLCRTEHMFFETDRLLAVRCALLSEKREDRKTWLEKLFPMQQADFEGIFREMDGLPVTIRLLDWPLHEFMPQNEHDLAPVAQALGMHLSGLARRVQAMHETNPMLGHRGIRLGLTHPDIYAMQVQAILRAALRCRKDGIHVEPEIMVPLVFGAGEMQRARALVDQTASEVFSQAGSDRVKYHVGTMLETPRACLVADHIAEHAEFCSFGTNDLTQTTFGVSRDDAGRFFPEYMGEELSLLSADPFVTLDAEGVGALLRIAVDKARSARPDIKLGICGEHGGDPTSIRFVEALKLDYVSCSPFRVQVARLAAAQAASKTPT
ncbi:MAG: pyruvate, phosphate dikinase [Myxococcales bacterium]|nr:pyruvate, phosphate dikinase [Myxococcales bacterium]MCB9708405.1 pyruvate, phosphate dikinase [Myxococcales bacterium]